EVGMAARAGLDWSASGLRGIDVEGGAAALLRLAGEESATPAVLPIDWRKFAARTSEGTVRPFFRFVAGDMTPAPTGQVTADWLRSLEGTAPSERQRRLHQLLAGEVASVLGLSSARPPSP